MVAYRNLLFYDSAELAIFYFTSSVIEIVKSTGLNELTVPGEEIAASQTKLIAAEEYLKTSDMNSDNNEVELVIPHGSKANYLRIVNPSEEGVSLRVTVCEVTDLSRIRTRNPAVFPRLEAVVQRVRRQSAIRR